MCMKRCSFIVMYIVYMYVHACESFASYSGVPLATTLRFEAKSKEHFVGTCQGHSATVAAGASLVW